ncbi:hypothetical protein BDR03DRAFT_940567 [Suillus americanus]|nr:hypothetical protein BDR03DRAFT_940567 [Suillus americanus]
MFTIPVVVLPKSLCVPCFLLPSVATAFSIMIDPWMYGSSQSGAVTRSNDGHGDRQTFTSLEFASHWNTWRVVLSLRNCGRLQMLGWQMHVPGRSRRRSSWSARIPALRWLESRCISSRPGIDKAI